MEEGINSQTMESRITKNMSHPRGGALTASAQSNFRIAVDQRLLCFSNYSSYLVEMFFGYSASFHCCIVCVCARACVTHRWMFSIAVHYGTAGSVVAESPEVEAQIQGPDCEVSMDFHSAWARHP